MTEVASPQGGTMATWPQAGPVAQSDHSQSRLLRYSRYKAYYVGDQWETPPAPGERRLIFNYCRVFCNKAAAYLFGKPPMFDASPLDGQRTQQAADDARLVELYLQEVAEVNALAALDLDAGVSAAMLGDGAFTVRWDAALGYPRITMVDPVGIDARWRQDDLTSLLWVSQKYYLTLAEMTPAQRGRLTQAPEDQYQPLEAREEWTATAWRLMVGDQEIDGGVNPYKQVPYILFPNLRLPGEFWGESDLADLLRLQLELNSRLSIFSRILEVAGNPVAVVTGADAQQTESLRLGPNQLWTLPEGAKAEVMQLLQAGGAEAHFKYLDAVYRAMHDIAEMPRTSFGDSSGQSQARSGVALEIELQPLLHKLARKRAILTPALLRRAALVLAVARVHGANLPAVRLRVQWSPVLPTDRTELVNQETRLVAAGIHPPTVAMAALGDQDPDTQLAAVLAQAKLFQAAGLLTRPHPTADSAQAAPALQGGV